MEKTDSSNDTFKSANFDGTELPEAKQTCQSVDIFESIKDNDFDEEDYRRKTLKRLIIISVSSIILLLLILGAIIGILIPIHAKSNPPSSLSSKDENSIRAICNSTLYPDSCFSSISTLKLSTNENPAPDPDLSPRQIFMLSLKVTRNELLISLKSYEFKHNEYNTITQTALDVCAKLIQDGIDHVNMSITSLQQDSIDELTVDDVRTWLSTAVTDQETCLDGVTEFQNNISQSVGDEMKAAMRNATMFTSNSLAIISKVPAIIQRSRVRRKVLQIPELKKVRPNVTVAKDGSGDYETITEAVAAVPRRSKERFFVYVKEGEYDENVLVGSECWNLMIFGDGMNKTIVSGSLNNADGVSTYNSGTFIAEGRGFIAKDIGFKNTAGPKKLQAVAVRSSSDHSIFHRCSFDAYQDTLYIHANRQFYSECRVAGTVDFIFGNAAAVFQNCSIQPRQPGPGQYNTVTAQSKSDPNQNTGISIHQCRISPSRNLTARTFLGRPWNAYSTTVVMETEIQGVVDPAGWVQWEPNVEVPDTIFYAEYKNTGPGSGVEGRVTWPGYRPDITEDEAEKFSVEQFIQGNKWLTKANTDHD